MELDTITHLLIDGDGVLYKRNDPLPGFDALFAALAKRDIGWALLTNNATRDVSDYVEKLGALGVEATEGQIFSSARATAETLKARYAEGDHLYVIGMQGLVDSLEAAGFVCHQGDDVPDQPVRAVVTALDLDITYGKIAAAMHLIRAGAAFIATNPDLTFPTPE
ncbi:MAG: HAD-IIA family hydrolase [Anaerolineae bacterium]